MSAFLGTLGRLVPIYSTPSMSVALRKRYSTDVTLEGRVKVQVLAGVQRREWSLKAEAADTAEAGTLQAFVSGEWGNGPFVWVTPTAPVTNMLTPTQASCDPSTVVNGGVTAAGPLSLGADGWAGRSFVNATPSTPFSFGAKTTPVLPGQRVTASAYLVGTGASLRISWYDAAGVFVSSANGAAGGVAGVATRLSVSGPPPSNAAMVLVTAVNATQAARPAVTWTSEMFPWAAGEGCPAAIISESEQTMTSADDYVDGSRYADLSFTITEVG